MSISRRKFLGWVGGAVGASTVAKAGYTKGNFKGYPDSYGVLHDTTKCVGCRKCEEACYDVNKAEYDLPKPEKPFVDLELLNKKRRTNWKNFTVVNKYEAKKELEAGKKESVRLFRKNQCNHCLEPACASACFVNAFNKTPQGAVQYDVSICVGCRYCINACPFYIPTYNYESWKPQVFKCTLCLPRTKEGKLPGCVETCPTEALLYGKRDELLKVARERISNNPDKYVDHIYGEHEVGGTSWLYLSSAPFTELGLPELGTKTAPEYTHEALSIVPIVVGLWPVLLTGLYAINKQRKKDEKQSKEQAVAQAIADTEAQAKEQLAKTKADLESKKTKEIEKAVKKALDEQAKKNEESS